MNDALLPDDLSQWPRDPYVLLGVAPGVSARDLRKAYSRLIRRFKPEQYPEHFRRIRDAYETVERETNPKFWSLIQAFKQLTGIPVMLNTSFNENEPIVCTPRDAIECFVHNKIDCLAIGNFWFEKDEKKLISEKRGENVICSE